jgi:two-component system sensor histidine kinase RegB
MKWLTQSQTGFHQAARYLLGLRMAIVVIQLVALTIAETLINFSYRTEAVLLSLLYATLAVVGWLWFTHRPPQAAATVSAGLALDLLMIGGWLLATGGYTNPLTSLLLLPIAIAIILVPLHQSIALTVLGVGIYTALVFWHPPLTISHHGSDSLAQLHLLGMWITFTLTSVILLLIVGTLARRLHRQQTQLSDIRERRLRDEQIIAMGLSAAGVAHRLGTPLNTMTLLVEEMRSAENSKQLTEDLVIMERQLSLCTNHLQQLSAAATQVKQARLETLNVSVWLQRLRESATLLWPAGIIEWQFPVSEYHVAVDATLDQAILNILANALTASPQWVGVNARHVDDKRIQILIEDHGDGLEAALHGEPGENIVHSERGLGVGLFLSNATIQRFDGTLKARVTEAGTAMIIDLPRAYLDATHA